MRPIRLLARLHRLVRAAAPARPLGIARAVVGGAAVLRAAEAARILPGVLDPASLRFRYAEWIPDLPPAGVPILLAAWTVAGVLFALGLQTRVAGLALAGIVAYVLVLDQQTYSNHLYLLFILCVLLTLADSGAAVSLDARRRGERPAVPAWPVALLKLQASIVYGFAALAKLNPLYLSGVVLAMQLRSDGPLAVPATWRVFPLMSFLAAASALAEAFVAFGLWSRRWRPLAVAVGIGFHLGAIALMIVPVQLTVFAMMMVSLYPLFTEPAAPPDRT